MNYSGHLIQAQIPRDCVGKDHKRSAWDRLLPLLGNPNPVDADRLFYTMPSGSLLSEKFKGRSLSKQKFEEKEKFMTAHQKAGMFVILTRDIGLGRKIVEILVNRPILHYKRIEEFIAGFVDSLWLANEQVFLFGSSERSLIKDLVRKIFATGTFSLGSLVDQWKEWGNFLFHTLAVTTVIGDLGKPAGNNIFSKLNRIPYISRVFEGDRDMLLMQHVSHLISSRQMPYMGSETEKKSEEKFKKVLTSDFKPDPELIFKLGAAARRIGGICKSIRPGSIPDGVAHISVTSSGEYGHSVAKGAQAAAVKEAMERILTIVPDRSEVEYTPFGPVEHHKGIPLWKTLFREVPLETEDPFLHPFFVIKEQEGRFRGLDEVTGKQLMYVAWKEYQPCPTLRAEVVPELGNKARFVTLSSYWLNMLQAPLAHVLIDAMKWHPSVFSSFHRQDQAFEAVKGMAKMKRKILRPNEAVLSSDLKDATNAQQWEVTKSLLRGFISGYGLSTHNTDYIELVLDTIGPRRVQFKDGSEILTTVGIMMGEAIAKPSLTLLNLSIEELAFIQYNSAERILYLNEPSPYRDWRYLHIGGDDHLAVGPIEYLNSITTIHRGAGSHIDDGKHGFSRYCVKYTERLINISNLQYGKPFDQNDHNRSIIVDSVKVRLLERGQSTMIKKDNKNVAIGKSTQLGGCLEWLPKDSRFFTEDKKASIRALFIERMGPLLPREAVNPRAFNAIHLPTSVGGYGLGMSHELQKFLEGSPEPHKGLIYKAHIGLPVKPDLKIFRRLNCNTSDRGVENIQLFQQKIVDQLAEYPRMVNAIGWKDLLALYPDERDSAKKVIARASLDNILSFEEFAKRATRGNLFQNVLMGAKNLKVFNTSPYVQTYKNIVWPYAELEGLVALGEGPLGLSNTEIAIAIKNIAPQWYFDCSQVTCMDTGYWDPEDPDSETWNFEEDTYLGKYTRGFPSFDVGFKVLNLKH